MYICSPMLHIYAAAYGAWCWTRVVKFCWLVGVCDPVGTLTGVVVVHAKCYSISIRRWELNDSIQTKSHSHRVLPQSFTRDVRSVCTSKTISFLANTFHSIVCAFFSRKVSVRPASQWAGPIGNERRFDGVYDGRWSCIHCVLCAIFYDCQAPLCY